MINRWCIILSHAEARKAAVFRSILALTGNAVNPLFNSKSPQITQIDRLIGGGFRSLVVFLGIAKSANICVTCGQKIVDRVDIRGISLPLR